LNRALDIATPLASDVRSADMPTTLVAHVRRADAMSVPWPAGGREGRASDTMPSGGWPSGGRDGRVSDMVLERARRGRRFA
jgi:hypothetical protein